MGSTVPAHVHRHRAPTELTVAVIYEKDDLVGSYFLSREGFSAHFDQLNDGQLFVSADKGELASVRTAIDEATAAYPTRRRAGRQRVQGRSRPNRSTPC